jgi:hypothetical protein
VKQWMDGEERDESNHFDYYNNEITSISCTQLVFFLFSNDLTWREEKNQASVLTFASQESLWRSARMLRFGQEQHRSCRSVFLSRIVIQSNHSHNNSSTIETSMDNGQPSTTTRDTGDRLSGPA